MRRGAISGTGWVGSSVAISTLHAGVADELLVYDVREAVAEGEAMDLAHGASFHPSRGQDGAFGIKDVALSLPVVVGAQGAVDVLEPEISAEERQLLARSAEVLRSAAGAGGNDRL